MVNTAHKNILGLWWDSKCEGYWGNVFIDLSIMTPRPFPSEFITNSKSVSKNKVFTFFFPRCGIAYTQLDNFLYFHLYCRSHYLFTPQPSQKTEITLKISLVTLCTWPLIDLFCRLKSLMYPSFYLIFTSILLYSNIQFPLIFHIQTVLGNFQDNVEIPNYWEVRDAFNLMHYFTFRQRDLPLSITVLANILMFSKFKKMIIIKIVIMTFIYKNNMELR